RLQCLDPVPALRHHLDVLASTEDQPETDPHHFLVVGQHHPDRHRSASPGPPTGSVAVTLQRPSGRGPASSSPPSSRHRSASASSPIPFPAPAPAGIGPAPPPPGRSLSTCTCTRAGSPPTAARTRTCP